MVALEEQLDLQVTAIVHGCGELNYSRTHGLLAAAQRPAGLRVAVDRGLGCRGILACRCRFLYCDRLVPCIYGELAQKEVAGWALIENSTRTAVRQPIVGDGL